MHKLENGSQVTTRPARKPTAGVAGYFSESNDGGAPSYPGADWFNDNIDEFQNALAAAGVAYDPAKLTHLAQAFGQLTRSKFMMDVSGTANAITLTTPSGKQPVPALNDYDEFSFIVAATNSSSSVTLKIDDLDAIALLGISSDTQIFETALLTVRYIGGAFYIAEQINPKTGNSVADIAKLITDTTDILYPGEYALDGSELSRADHPIAFAIAAASSNYIDQAAKDADPIAYGGYYGDGDGVNTFTLPMLGGEFIRMFDDGRGVDDGRAFGSWQEDLTTIAAGVILRVGSFGGSDGAYDLTGSSNTARSTDLHEAPYGNSGAVYYENRPRSIAYYGKTKL